MYEKAVSLGCRIDVEESSHLAGHQQHPPNAPASNVRDYHKLNLTSPLLDHVISELGTQFNSESSSTDYYRVLRTIPPPKLCDITASPLTPILFSKSYEDDLPSPQLL